MCKEYKSYDNLEGKVEKALKKSLGFTKGINLAAHVIAIEIWNTATEDFRVPDDKDISRGIYEYFGSAR